MSLSMTSPLPLDPVFQLVLEVPTRTPSPDLPRRLTRLFKELAMAEARPLLDHLVAMYPDWPEAWNKRATLASIEKRDADSLLDIAQTLRLEPRHFGAIAGFGNICLRNGHLNEARAAFQIALSINPHMDDLRDMLENLSPHHLMLH